MSNPLKTHHGRSTVSRDLGTLGSGSLPALIDGKVTSNGPSGSTDALSSLVELGSHVEVMNSGLATINGIEDNERVNFEVCKVEVDINGVEADEEVDEGVLFIGRDVGKEGSGNFLACGERFIDRDFEHKSLGIDVTNVNTTLVGEENAITLALRVDANVVFSVRRVGKERLDNKVVQGACNSFNLESRASEKNEDREKASGKREKKQQ